MAQNPPTDSLDYAVGTILKHYTLTTPQVKTADGVYAKSHRLWTGKDMPYIETSAMKIMLRAVFEDRVDLVDRLKPDAMSRGEFVHAILRECERRDILKDIFKEQLAIPYYGNNRSVEDARALRAVRLEEDLPIASRVVRADGQTETRKGTLKPVDLAAYGAMTEMLQTGTLHPRFGANLAATMYRGLPGISDTDKVNAGFTINSDMRAYVLGYFFGAQPEFNPANPNWLLDGTITFPDESGRRRSRDEVQADYCPNIERVFEPGNIMTSTGQIDVRGAATWAAAQARVDSRSGFAGDNVSFGIFEPCPPTPANNNDQQTASRTAATRR